MRKKQKCQRPLLYCFLRFVSPQLVRCFCQIAVVLEILTRQGTKIHSQRVLPRRSFSATTIFRQKLNVFLITFYFVFVSS